MGVAHLHYGRVLLASLHELVVCQLGVLVAIHVPKDLVDALIVKTRAGDEKS